MTVVPTRISPFQSLYHGNLGSGGGGARTGGEPDLAWELVPEGGLFVWARELADGVLVAGEFVLPASELVLPTNEGALVGDSRRSISDRGTTNFGAQMLDNVISFVVSDSTVPATRSPLRRCKTTPSARHSGDRKMTARAKPLQTTSRSLRGRNVMRGSFGLGGGDIG